MIIGVVGIVFWGQAKQLENRKGDKWQIFQRIFL